MNKLNHVVTNITNLLYHLLSNLPKLNHLVTNITKLNLLVTNITITNLAPPRPQVLQPLLPPISRSNILCKTWLALKKCSGLQYHQNRRWWFPIVSCSVICWNFGDGDEVNLCGATYLMADRVFFADLAVSCCYEKTVSNVMNTKLQWEVFFSTFIVICPSVSLNDIDKGSVQKMTLSNFSALVVIAIISCHI